MAQYDDDGIVIFDKVPHKLGEYEWQLDNIPLRFHIMQDAPIGHRIVTAMYSHSIHTRSIEIARGHCTVKTAREFCQNFNVNTLLEYFESEIQGSITIKWTKFIERGATTKIKKVKVIATKSTLTDKFSWRATLSDDTIIEFSSGDEKAAKYRAYRIAKDKGLTVVTQTVQLLGN